MAYSKRNLCILLASLCWFACGDDEPAGGAGSGGEGGSSGTIAAGSGGGTAGASGRAGGGGASGRAGSGGAAGMMAAMCSEPPPAAPVVCGGQTCPTPMYMMNQCVYPCCAKVGGADVCGAKSTNPMLATECEPMATPDPSCPDADSMGTPLKGCCNVKQGKCGIISSVRPGCITSSMLIMLPDPPKACTGAGDDAGAPDAGI